MNEMNARTGMERPPEPMRLPGSFGLTIIIVTYNSATVLPGLLDSLPAGLEGITKFETIIVDNDSHDGSVHIALTHPIGAGIIRMGRNAGYAAAINAATATVDKGSDLLILNPDVRLRPGAAKVLVDRLTDPSVGIAVPCILDEDGTISWSIRREPSITTAWTDAVLGGILAARIGTGEMVGNPAAYQQEAAIDWATGAIVAVSARAREVVGDWDESFFLYMEEVEYMRRVRDRGLAVVYIPEAHAIHIGGEYSQNPRLSQLLSINRIRYHRRHHGPVSTAFFRLSVLIGQGIRSIYGPSGHRAAMRAALMPYALPVEYQMQNSPHGQNQDPSHKGAESSRSTSAISEPR
jgi:GT2 family glycosyltransferase